MATSHQTDVTESNPETYNSSSLSRFAWTPNPFGKNGFLHVVFNDGSQYIYFNVPSRIAEELEDRSYNPQNYENSVGQFFYEQVRNEFDRRNEEYQKI
jgi:hypothetical protein